MVVAISEEIAFVTTVSREQTVVSEFAQRMLTVPPLVSFALAMVFAIQLCAVIAILDGREWTARRPYVQMTAFIRVFVPMASASAALASLVWTAHSRRARMIALDWVSARMACANVISDMEDWIAPREFARTLAVTMVSAKWVWGACVIQAGMELIVPLLSVPAIVLHMGFATTALVVASRVSLDPIAQRSRVRTIARVAEFAMVTLESASAYQIGWEMTVESRSTRKTVIAQPSALTSACNIALDCSTKVFKRDVIATSTARSRASSRAQDGKM